MHPVTHALASWVRLRGLFFKLCLLMGLVWAPFGLLAGSTQTQVIITSINLGSHLIGLQLAQFIFNSIDLGSTEVDHGLQLAHFISNSINLWSTAVDH